MIPSRSEVEQWQNKPCFACHQPLTFPCMSLPGPHGALNLHHACIWPFFKLVMEDLLRLEGEHPEQLPTSQAYREAHGKKMPWTKP